MKTISNSKHAAAPNGVVIYRMERLVAGTKLDLMVAVTERELLDGRTVVALKLRRARHGLRRMVEIAAAGASLLGK